MPIQPPSIPPRRLERHNLPNDRRRHRQQIRAVRFAAGLALGLAGGITAPQVAAQILPNAPDAIVCSVRDPTGALPWERLVFYVSARTIDNRTLYKTLTSDPVVLFVGEDGIVDGVNLADCDGKTVDQLAADGQALQLTTSPATTPRP